jgi:hypothetical protein
MAEKTTKAAEKQAEDLVEVFIPVRDKRDPNFYISINDKSWLMPRGATYKLPRYVAEEIKRSQRAEAMRDRNQQVMLDNAASKN